MSKTHGHSSRNFVSGTYKSWYAMLQRCYNTKNKRYNKYGGRGITVCEEWKKFESFLADMGERPDKLTLNRKDNEGNYDKNNCVWATYIEQNANKGMQSNNTSGVTGVSWKVQIARWVARGQINGVDELLYCGPSFDAACEARFEWEDYRKASL